MLFGYCAVVRVKRVFVGTVYYRDSVDEETLFETKSGLVWTTHPCGALLSFHCRWAPAGAGKTWIRHVLAPGEKREDSWAIGEE